MMKEKANVQSAAPRKVKGTVLFTVVCVMMVLIVFLMGTLALASTANKRAQTNYQKEQSEYTARAVLDAVVDVINQDTDGTGLKKDIAEDSVTSVNVAMDGQNYTVNIAKQADTKPIYVNATDGWKDVPIYSVSVNIASNTTAAETVYTAFLTADMNSKNGGGGGGGGGGAFVAMGQLTGDLGAGGYITGGSFINVENIGTGTLGNYLIGNAGGGTTIDAPVYIYGNVSTSSKTSYVRYSNEGDCFGIEGNFIPTNAGFMSDFGEASTFGWTNSPSTSEVQYDNIPVFYVGGVLDCKTNSSKFTMGSTDVPVNIFSGSFKLGSNDVNIYGDLYAFDATQPSEINSGGMKNLYSWSKRTITGQATNHLGNIITAGDLKIEFYNNDLTVEGDLKCAGTLNIIPTNNEKTLHIKGDLVIPGTLTVPGNVNLVVDKGIYASTIVNNGKIDAPVIKCFNASGGSYTKASPDVKTDGLTVDHYDEYKVYYTNDGGGQFGQWDHNNHKLTLNASGQTLRTHYIRDGEPETYTDEKGLQNIVNENFPVGPTNNNEEDYQAYLNTLRTTNPTHKWLLYSEHTTAATAIEMKDPVYNGSFTDLYAGEVFPAKYEKSKMPDALYKIPQKATYTTGYPTEITDTVFKDIYDTATNKYKVTEYTTADFKEVDVAGGKRKFLEVNNNCVLSGNMSCGGNIYINPTSAITVVLDNFVLDEDHGGKCSVIINDSAPVTLFVRGNCQIKTEGIITKNYLELFTGSTDVQGVKEFYMNNALTIHEEIDTSDANESKYLPNVILYGETGSVLDLDGNNVVLTAQVRAPEMTFKQKMGKGANITYVRASGATKQYNTGDNTCIGVIGQLIAKTITLDNSAKWGMIYVTQKDKRCAVCKANGCTTCTGAAGCPCTCAGCTCHGGGGGGGGSSKYADKFNVLYYNIY